MKSEEEIKEIEELERDLMEIFNLSSEYRFTIYAKDYTSEAERNKDVAIGLLLERDALTMLLKYSLIADIEKDKFLAVASEKFELSINFDNINSKDLLANITRSLKGVNKK